MNSDPEAPRLITFDELVDGGLTELETMVQGAEESVVLHREGTDVRAWLNVCPHAGRRLDWAPGKFLVSKDGHLVCAAHGAAFELPSGLCVSGPCRGQSLQAVPVRMETDGVRLG